LYGGAGNDFLTGGEGADMLNGGGDGDIVVYAAALSGIDANLTRGTGAGAEAGGDIYVDIEHIWGSQHDDTLTGNGANNYLFGSNGSDELTGAAGSDTLEGGLGVDRFVFSASDLGFGSTDLIVDFEDGIDVLILSGFRPAFTSLSEVDSAVHIREIGYDGAIIVQNATIKEVQDQIAFL
jgi:Ca2+-binding RTX toxin-like protein